MKEFVHLHLHTEYSLLDGMCRINKVTQLARKHGMKALAITDHGSMAGVLKFYEESIQRGLKPILGAEMYIAPESRHDQKYESKKEAFFHITLLAKNNKGYQNLLKLSTLSYTEGFYYKPRIDKEILAEHSEGIIILGGCLSGEVNQHLLKGNIDKAVEAVGKYQDIAGKDSFFLELMDNKIPDQNKANNLMIELAKKTGAGLVATNDCHYLKKEDAFAHEVLLCIQTLSHIDDKDRMRFQTEEFYFKTPEEMCEAFKDIPEAIKNTVAISEKCNVKIDLEEYHLPIFYPPDGKTSESYLEGLIRNGLKKRFNIDCKSLISTDIKDEITERAAYEFEIIKKMGFASYFLIIQDFVNEAKRRDIKVGPGRGSAAGSLVAYLLGITEINPLQYNLIFERFLNPERVSLPDIDVDFCDRRRDEVISYIRDKYGKENVAQIGTYGRMAARAVLRDVGRALGFSYSEVDRLAKLISPEPGVMLEEESKSNPEIKKIIDNDERVKRLFDISLKLEGLARHSSTHAAGLVITEKPVYEYVPLFRGSKAEVATQYEMEGIEKIGLLKVDILGLKTLAVIGDTLKLIKEKRGVEIKDFELGDKATYQMLSRGESLGIFQLESKGMRDLLKESEPKSFEDIIAILALYRPGPMKSGMVKEYIKRKKDPSKIAYDHPLLEPILKTTYGVILYQEQVMEIAHRLAGFSMGEADELRKAMGKKIQSVMDEKQEKFVEGARKNGISASKAAKIFEQISKFAGYGFNKSHSAGYALISYQTAYLKANYPLEFMTALLNSERGNFAKISEYIDVCDRMNIRVLQPDICESGEGFQISDKDIIFGLAAIKNVGVGAIKSIIEEREKGSFKSLVDFCERVNLRTVNKKVLESLIKAGAFDYLNTPRAQLFAVMDETMNWGAKEQKKIAEGHMDIFGSAGGSVSFVADDEKLKECNWTDKQQFFYEKEVLGVYLTGHPLQEFNAALQMFSDVSISQLEEDVKDGISVRIGGILTGIKKTNTKKGERMGWGELEDLTGRVKVLFYPRIYEEYSSLIRKDAVRFIKGRLEKRDGVTVIVEEIANLNTMKDNCQSNVEVDIRLPLDDEKLSRLKEIFLRNKGKCPLYLNLIKEDDRRVKMRAIGYTVNPDTKFIDELKALLGDASVFHLDN